LEKLGADLGQKMRGKMQGAKRSLEKTTRRWGEDRRRKKGLD